MVRRYFRIPSAFLIPILLITACSQTEPAPTATPITPSPTVAPVVPIPTEAPIELIENLSTDCHPAEKLNSILWIQTSGEYLMAATQSYTLARVMLDRGLEDSSWTAAVEQTGDYSNLPPAIIVDVDETVLDNTPFHARLERAGINWNTDQFYAWVLEAKAQAVPGSVEFLQYAQSKDVAVIYMTNRSHDYEQATRENLIKNGFPMDDEIDTLLTHGEEENWGSDKVNRRSFLAENYRIILLIGDTLNDFVPNTNVNPEDRAGVLAEHQEYWNERWIIIPNPIYGGWEGALYNFDYSLSKAQIFDHKLNYLDTFE